LTKTLIFLDNKEDLNFLNIVKIKFDTKIFSFNIHVHNLLYEKNILHEIAETYFLKNDRFKIFDTAVSCWDWNEKIRSSKSLTFEEIDLLGIFDTAEFHHLIIRELYLFLLIQRIIEKENPTKIITTKHFSKIINCLTNNKEINIETYHSKPHKFLIPWNKILIKFNIGKIPISLPISRFIYIKLKNLIDLTLASIFGLWFDFNKKKSILFLEFNSAQYEKLLEKCSKFERNLIFFNRRRPTFWGFSSIQILRSYNVKIISSEKILNYSEKQKVKTLTKDYTKKLEKLWNDDTNFKMFFINEQSFWPLIKNVLFEIYKKRLSEYISLILSSKKILNNVNISCIVSLNAIGETEKAFLGLNKNKISSIVLEHGFTNYDIPELSRFDVLHRFFNDKIAVWGELQEKYFVEYRKISKEKILITGSPRHDSFFLNQTMLKTNSQKIILLTPGNLDESNAQFDTLTFIRYEKLLRKILSVVKKMKNVRLIVKLHPSQDPAIDYIKKIITKLDSSIPIYQVTPILDLIRKCDVMINIMSDVVISTVVLEGLILDKPILNITMMDKTYEFECIKDNAVLSISDKSELEHHLVNILENDELRSKLILNGRKHVKRYLANTGNASECLANILNSY